MEQSDELFHGTRLQINCCIKHQTVLIPLFQIVPLCFPSPLIWGRKTRLASLIQKMRFVNSHIFPQEISISQDKDPYHASQVLPGDEKHHCCSNLSGVSLCFSFSLTNSNGFLVAFAGHCRSHAAQQFQI